MNFINKLEDNQKGLQNRKTLQGAKDKVPEEIQSGSDTKENLNFCT